MTPKKDFYSHHQRRPVIVPPRWDGIPAALRADRRWVMWRLKWRPGKDGRHGKWTKVPYQISGATAKCNDPATWDTFEGVRAAFKSGHYDGVGFMFGDGSVGVDLDNAVDPETNRLYPWAAAIVESLGTYTEISPSGTGVKLFGRGKWNGLRHKWAVADDGGGEIEAYDAGRYFVVTGMGGGEVAADNRFQQALDGLAASCPATKPTEASDNADHTGAGDDVPDLPDEELIRLARVAKNGDKFARLWAGDLTGYGSPSESDLALCGMLAFWCGKDAVRMDRLFRLSKLLRPKWDEPRGDSTYGATTIATAIDGCHDVYSGPTPTAPPSTTGGPTAYAAVTPAEADDDPHRLARGFRASLAPAGEPPRLRHWLDQWWEWRDGVYRQLADGDLRARLHRWVRLEYERLWGAEQEAWTAAGAKGSAPVMRKITTAATANVLAALKAIANLSADLAPPAWLDGATGPEPKDVIVFPNGLLDATTRQLHPASPCFFTSNVIGCAYDPAAPAPVAFDDFLAQVLPDAEAVAAAWEWVALVLTNETRYHKFLHLIGPRRAGKSTFVKVLEAAAGAGSVAAATLSGLAEPFGLSALLGKSVAVISEARIAPRGDSATAVSRLLAITGEDAVSINRKNKEIVTARLSTRFVIVGNELPDLPDTAGALAERMVVLPFPNTFVGREDRGLAGRLLAQLPGIVLKALDALADVRERGHLTQPACGVEHREEFEAVASPVGQFVAERCVVGPAQAVPAATLFAAWRRWCEEQQVVDVGSAPVFGKRLRAAVAGIKSVRAGAKRARVTQFHGIGLTGDIAPMPTAAPPADTGG